MSSSLLASDKAVPHSKPVAVFFLFALTFAVGLSAAALPFPDRRLIWVPHLCSAGLILFLSLWILRRTLTSYTYLLCEDRFLVRRTLFGRDKIILRLALSDVTAMGRREDLPPFRGKIYDCTCSLSAKRVSFGILYRVRCGERFVMLECRPSFASAVSRQVCVVQKKSLSS